MIATFTRPAQIDLEVARTHARYTEDLYSIHYPRCTAKD